MERILAQNLLVRRSDRGRLYRMIILYIIWESHPFMTCAIRRRLPPRSHPALRLIRGDIRDTGRLAEADFDLIKPNEREARFALGDQDRGSGRWRRASATPRGARLSSSLAPKA
jgi:hypothetical protein